MRIAITIEKTKTFLKLCSILCALILVLCIFYMQGYRINMSNSLPHWIYRIFDLADKTITRGDYVVLNNSLIVQSYTMHAGFVKKYLDRFPLLKQIGAISGDVVLLQDDHIYINGTDFGPMKIMSADSQGTRLSPFHTPVTLQSGQYWLVSNPDGGFDSRYFGQISRDCITHIAYPIY
jgi:conjugative transfer signal peptidase TraF